MQTNNPEKHGESPVVRHTQPLPIFCINKREMKRLLDWFRRFGRSHRTLMKVNNGELRITKKGKVKKANR